MNIQCAKRQFAGLVCTAMALCLWAMVSHGELVEISASSSGGVTRAQLDWQAIPGQTYSVHSTPSLLPASWANATPAGVTASNVLGTYDGIVPDAVQFYRIVREDTDPPVITNLVPVADAIAVVSNAQVMIYLDDQTGIDTNSISLTIGSWTNLALADSMLTWSNQTLTFNPTSVLGEAEAVISNALTVADTLGHTLSNYTWTFQLDHPTVATNAFLPLVAPPPGAGPQVLSINGVPRMRTLPGIAPLSGENEYHIVTVTSNTVVFAYTNTPPSIPVGTHLVSFDAAYPFYRDALSNSVNGVEQEITVWTTNIPLTDLMSEGALVSSEFVSGVPLALQGATAQGSGNLLHVEFGDDLSGKLLYEDSALKLQLLDGSSWGFVGDVDVALDIAFDLWTLSTELRSLDTSAGGTLTLNISPEAIFNYAISDGGSTPLVPPVTHIFGAMAGPIPVWVEVIMELNAGYEYSASVAGDAHTTVNAEKEVTFYVHLRDNEWTHGVHNPPLVLESDPITWNLEGEANVVVYIQPKLTVLVYSLAGLWADIKPYAELDGWYQLNPLEYEQAVYLGLSSTLGIESRIWYDGWGAKPEWELFDWKEMIWSDSYPTDIAPTFLSAFPDRTVTVGNKLTLSGYADGTPDPTYKWYYNGSKIVGETGPEYEIASANSGHAGTYSVNAQNSVGSVTTSCVVNVTSGTTPSSMVLIPGGTNAGTDPDFGAYSLTVSSFYMDRYEVTKALWDEVKNWNGGNGYGYDNAGSGKAANHPVQTVSWYDVVKWCNARSQKDGRMPVYYTDAGFTQVYKSGQVTEPYVKASANGYRLPTDEQWEYAARGGVASRRFPWGGDTIQHTRANYYSSTSYSYDTSSTRGYHPDYDDGGTSYTSPVGDFVANGYGLYDMTGNVWEWCYDWYPGYEGSYRVFRGGSWSFLASYCRVAFRNYCYPDSCGYSLGFRACLPPGQ